MMRKTIAAIVVAAAATFGTVGAAQAAGDAVPPMEQKWSTDGFFGKFDIPAVQRGFQVYREVCSSCHSLKRIAFRNLLEIGYTEEQAKEIAKEYEIATGKTDEDGEPVFRSAGLPDKIPGPYASDEEAKESNGGALPPDLSLITKARPNGQNYVYSILNGYEDAPADHEVPEGSNYNVYFPGHNIAMAQPLDDELVEYEDGSPNDLPSLSKDVVSFLTWAAEPELQERKSLGIKVILFLVILSLLLYAAKRRIWADVDH